jgi:hypothetical protein
MTFRAICIALLLSCLPIAGCGTVENLVSLGPVPAPKVPFGGVNQDVACIQAARNGELGVTTQAGSGPEHHAQVALTLLAAADLPLSLIGDVVTWPYTAAYTFINEPVPVPPVVDASADIRHQTPLPQLLPAPTPELPPPTPEPPAPTPMLPARKPTT